MDTFLNNQGNIENEVPFAEPCTYHRRGHKFESCTAHHINYDSIRKPIRRWAFLVCTNTAWLVPIALGFSLLENPGQYGYQN